MAAGQIRVLIVDEYAPVRAQVRALLSAESDMEVVGEAADGRAAAQRSRALYLL